MSTHPVNCPYDGPDGVWCCTCGLIPARHRKNLQTRAEDLLDALDTHEYMSDEVTEAMELLRTSVAHACSWPNCGCDSAEGPPCAAEAASDAAAD